MPGFALCCAGLLLALPVDAAQRVSVKRISALLDGYNTHSEAALPTLDADQLDDLVAERVVLVRDRRPLEDSEGEVDDRVRATGFRLFRKPRVTVWISTLYKPPGVATRLHERTVSMGANGDFTLYQYMAMPWPIRDRHWTIDISKDTDLAAATGDDIWEHRWQLADNGLKRGQEVIKRPPRLELDPDELAGAVYLPLNRGGWIAFRVDDEHTLLVGHVTTVMSGWIPDRFVAMYSSRTLNRIMQAIEQYTDRVAEEYDHVSYPVFSGGGELIRSRRVASAPQEGHPR